MSIRDDRRARRRHDQPVPIDTESYADPGLAERDARRGIHAPASRRRGSQGGDVGSGLGGIFRFLVFAVVLGSLVLFALLTVLRPLARVAVVGWAYDNSGALRIPFVADLVREDLGDNLTLPAGGDSAVVEFNVVAGDTPATIAARLKERNLIRDERAFVFLALEQNLAPRLREGTFLLRASMTPEQVVTGVVENRLVIRTVPVTFREGLRIEQMTAKLQTIQSAVDPKAFYDLAMQPPADLLGAYPWLNLPEGRSLEGFLYPATYTLVLDGGTRRPPTTALDLIKAMLDKFHSVAAHLLEVPAERGLTFYQVLTLASIVEREAVLDEERPLIAGVYQNRLNGLKGIAKILNADPTVIYAVDSMALAQLPFEDWKTYSFWNPPGVAMSSIDVPDHLAGYQTYRTAGLIPGPIVTPSLASIQAALSPNTSDGYLFFLAIPDRSGAHAFSKTQAEHDANRRKYGYL
jgi:UPF0755 protein